MKLSERLRPGSEAAPWVCAEVARMEAKLDALTTALARISLTAADSTSSDAEKARYMAATARAGLATARGDA